MRNTADIFMQYVIMYTIRINESLWPIYGQGSTV